MNETPENGLTSMQICLGKIVDWADLPIFLAIARAGTLGGASRQLGQTQPTMGRRLRALEVAVGHALFQRTSDGFVLTEEGHTLLAHAERMEEEALAIHRELAGTDQRLEGMLRVSCSDWFGVTLLAPVLAEFAVVQPRVVVELLTDQRLYSLPRREADLVLRMLPFDEPEVVSRRLMRIRYGLFCRVGTQHPIPGDGHGCPLIVMDSAFSGMPDVAWVRRLLPNAHIASRSNNREVQATLCARGVGLAVLPLPLGERTPGIERIPIDDEAPSRDKWVGYHRDMRRLGRLRALLEIIIGRLAD
jgi:DNA-binding transcriptional LysR family regulator